MRSERSIRATVHLATLYCTHPARPHPIPGMMQACSQRCSEQPTRCVIVPPAVRASSYPRAVCLRARHERLQLSCTALYDLSTTGTTAVRPWSLVHSCRVVHTRIQEFSTVQSCIPWYCSLIYRPHRLQTPRGMLPVAEREQSEWLSVSPGPRPAQRGIVGARAPPEI